MKPVSSASPSEGLSLFHWRNLYLSQWKALHSHLWNCMFFVLLLSIVIGCASETERLRKRVEEVPSDTLARMQLAKNLTSSGNIEAALEAYEALVEFDGDPVEAYLPMARLYARIGLFEDARVCGELLLWKRPASIEGHRMVARALLSMKPPRGDDAQEHLASLKDLGFKGKVLPFKLTEEESLLGRLRYKGEVGSFIVRATEEAMVDDLRRMIRNACLRLQPFYGIPPKTDFHARIYVFDTRQDFLAYSADYRPMWGDYGGFYCPRTRKIVTYAIPDEGGKREWLPRVLLHEMSHLFMHMALKGRYGRNHPIWLDEGLAEYHRTGWPTRPDFSISGSDQDLQAGAKWFFRKRTWIPVERFIRMPAVRKPEHYVQAWGMVHWMKKKHPKKLDLFLQRLREGQDGILAYKEAMIGIDNLDGRLRAWLEGL